jgi:HEPN domain-containing protein
LSTPPPESPDLAALLSRKAAGDEDVVRRLIDVPEVVDETLGFHAQQAVEKLIKAVLVRHGVGYDRTHNIAYLLTLLEGAGMEAPSGVGQEELIALSPWAVQFRYDDEAHAVLDRPSARRAVEMTRAWADVQLAAGSGDPG